MKLNSNIYAFMKLWERLAEVVYVYEHFHDANCMGGNRICIFEKLNVTLLLTLQLK